MIEDTTQQQTIVFEKFFSKLTKNQIIEFAAWSITPFFEDIKIIDFLNKINAEFVSKIQFALLNLKKATDLIEFFEEGVLHEIENITWFSDDYIGYDFDASEGAVKLLGAIECLMRYHKTSQKKWAIVSATAFLEQLDYYLTLVEKYENIKAWIRKLKDQEINAQKRYLAALECNEALSMESISHAKYDEISKVYTYM